MNAIKKFSLTSMLGLAAILAATSSTAATPPDVYIRNLYTCAGKIPGSNDFNETIILKKNGDTYTVQLLREAVTSFLIILVLLYLTKT